jgi:hypothetical protein
MSNTNYLKKHGHKLLANGFNVVPISPRSKAPLGLSEWSKINATATLVDNWIDTGFKGVGIQTKYCPAIDLDILDEKIRDEMLAMVKEIVGLSFRRVGKAPKILLPYRLEVNADPFKKVTSSVWIDDKGQEHKVEILADGQQFVAFGDHPDTGEPYEWVSDNNILDYKLSDLPTLNHDQAEKIVECFDAIAKGIPRWTLKAERKTAGEPITEEEAFFHAKTPLQISNDQVKSAVNQLDPDMGHDEWRDVGMGLWHQYSGSDIGFNMWDEWSSKSTKYNQSQMRTKWNSFNHKGVSNPRTFASVLDDAKKIAMGEDSVKKYLGRYVYVGVDKVVHDLEDGAEKPNVTLEAFKIMTARDVVRLKISKPTQKEPKRVDIKTVPAWSQWIEHPDKKIAKGFIYSPGGKRITRRGKYDYINRFRMPDFPEVAYSDAELNRVLSPFLEHMEHLFPVETEREWFINWIAFNIQYPGRRCQTVPLHTAISHGMGRGWVVKLMIELLGYWNCTSTTISQLVDGKFHDYLDKSLFCSIEEVREKSIGAFQVDDKIRAKLTDQRHEVNVKFGRLDTQDVYTNFFLMSNHPDALILKDEDRRINVFRCDAEPKPREYYRDLYQWVEGETGGQSDENPSIGVAALYHWLMKRDIDSTDWQEPLKNESREEMIQSTRSPVDQACVLFLEDSPFFAMKWDKIKTEVRQILSEEHPEYLFKSENIDTQMTNFFAHKKIKTGKRIYIKSVSGTSIQVRYRVIKPGEYSQNQIKIELEKQET